MMADQSVSDSRGYRVAQWGTGRIGATTLRDLLSSPGTEVVGVLVHSTKKEGLDAGELCGLEPVGVAATLDHQAIVRLKPDCVIATQSSPSFDLVCDFLEAGINIVTCRLDYLDPPSMDPAVRSRVEAACRKGGATIHSTGASPSFSSEALPLLAASMCRKIDSITIDEFADIPASCPDFQVLAMGFGRPTDKPLDRSISDAMASSFRQSVALVARALGVELDTIDTVTDAASIRNDLLLPGGTPLSAGTLGAVRIQVLGRSKGHSLICFRINWYVTKDVSPDWSLGANGWRVLIEGDTPIELNVSFPVPDDRLSTAMAGLSASRVLNALPYVCEAPPGICTTLDIPLVLPNLAHATNDGATSETDDERRDTRNL